MIEQMLTFKLPPFRLPSEAYSLLIRATRNCPGNKCEFGPMYKGKRFELRSVGQILADIRKAKELAQRVKELTWKLGYGGRASEVAIRTGSFTESLFGVYNSFKWEEKNNGSWTDKVREWEGWIE